MGKKKIRPPIFPPILVGGSRIFLPMEIQEAHFLFEFQDPNRKIGAWGDDSRNSKIRIFRQEGNISN